MNICGEITKKGEKCRIQVSNLKKYCHHHMKNKDNIRQIDITKITGRPLKIYKVKGDGFCFWRSIAYCIEKDQEAYKKIIKIVLNKKKIEDNISLTWVETGEMPLISKYLEKDIVLFYNYDSKLIKNIYRKDGINIDMKIVNNFGNSNNDNSIIIYYNNFHYDPLY